MGRLHFLTKAFRRPAIIALASLSLISVAALPTMSEARTRSAPAVVSQEPPLVIRSDSGGRLKDYLARLQEVDRTGRRVEIRGSCYSSCTIFLSARNVCVTETARLGFHGPRYRTREVMPRDRFDHWSSEIADHYPPSLARWYMEDARFTIQGLKVVTGANIMPYGIPACQ